MNSTEVLIRAAVLQDKESVVNIFREVLPNADFTVKYPAFQAVEKAFVEWKLNADDGGDMHLFFENESDRILFVADYHGLVVGMSGVILSQDGAELVRMQILPQFRRKGIGRNLLMTCAEWARENGATRMFLDTFVVNVSAQKFYENNGFVKKQIIQFELVDRFQQLGLDKVPNLTIEDLKSWEMWKEL